MFDKKRLFVRLISSTALIVSLGMGIARAQDSALEDIKYKEDYDRIQAMLKVTDVQKRLDRMLLMYKDRPDLSDQLQTYLDNLFTRDLQTLMKQQNFALLKPICERAVKTRPKFGEPYLFLGVALKNEKKNQEALAAFAKCSVITNQFQKQAKQQMEVLYRAENGGSLIGIEKLTKQAAKDLR
jgi:hypothetical protein